VKTAQPHPRQVLIAQADMAAWLAYPTELEQQPDEIQLIRTIELPTREFLVWHARTP
jgi:hypothetical protein